MGLLEAIECVFCHEGVYSNDPNDPGGETFYGIARERQPQWKGWASVDRFREDPAFPDLLGRDQFLMAHVKQFYQKWWSRISGEDLPQDVATELFESSFNIGPKVKRWVQECCNSLNRNGRDWEELVEDGKIGPKTIAAVNACVKRRGSNLVKLLNVRQGGYYYRLARRNPEKWERYLNGWLNRVAL